MGLLLDDQSYMARLPLECSPEHREPKKVKRKRMGLLKGCGQNPDQLGSVKDMVINSGSLLCPLCCQGGQRGQRGSVAGLSWKNPSCRAVLLSSVLTWAWRRKIVSVERSPRKGHHCPERSRSQPSAPCGEGGEVSSQLRPSRAHTMAGPARVSHGKSMQSTDPGQSQCLSSSICKLFC